MSAASGITEQTSIANRVATMARAGRTVASRSPIASALPFAFAFFTDDRRHGDLLALLEAFPVARAVGPIAVVFRHNHLAPEERQALGDAARSLVWSKGHFFFVAGPSDILADGRHNAYHLSFVSRSIHCVSDARPPLSMGYISPVFPTRSHPGAPSLGIGRTAAIARRAPCPCFALGGIDQYNWKRLIGLPLAGIAAIGAITD